MTTMRIGELSRITGVSTRSLRYYEEQGLLVGERLPNGYRDYTPEAVDTIMKLGMAHPMGPLQLADFIGLDTCLAILRVLHEGLGNPKYAPCPLLVQMVAAGKLGVKSGEGFYQYTPGSKDLVVAAAFRK